MYFISHLGQYSQLWACFNDKKIVSVISVIALFAGLPPTFAENMRASEEIMKPALSAVHTPFKVPSLTTINPPPQATPKAATRLLTDLLSQIAPSTEANAHVSATALEKKAHALIGQNLSQSLSSTLSRYGKAQVDIFLEKGYGVGGRIDWLAPLYETQEQLLFSQIGVGREQKSTLVNIGLGHRHFCQQSMFGYYAFLDADVNNGHLRTGLGIEGAYQYTKFGSNFYLPLSKWKRVEQTYWEVRPARGYDIRTRLEKSCMRESSG